MAEITAAMVKALREKTSQGMMECKKALIETSGDIDAARDILRKRGAALAEKKAERSTSEGRVAIKISDDGTSAVMVEVACETDFCARNDVFKAMVADIVDLAMNADAGDVAVSDAIDAAIQAALAKIGENMSYGRGVKITAPKIASYLHHNSKVGVLIGIDGELDEESMTGLCMHIAFADPVGITVDDIPSDVVEKERAFALEQAEEAGKPKEIAEMMVEGKMRKFMAGKALLEQAYVRDEKKQIKEVLGDAKVTAFARFAVGG